MANRRKTLQRKRLSLGRLLRPRRNRRTRPPRPQNPAQPAPPKAPFDWRGLGRRALWGLVWTLRGLAALGVLAGAGAGGYWGYQRLAASTAFNVAEIHFEGAKRAPVADLQRLVQTVRGLRIYAVDLDAVRRSVTAHPWVKGAEARRELPRTLVIRVSEHTAKAALLLGHLYLVSAEGTVFKRATAEEAAGLPVITGLSRLAYLSRPRAARPHLRRALAAVKQYQGEGRPPLSEVNLGSDGEVTLYLRQGGTALRFGRTISEEKLARLDTVWSALGPDTRRARVIQLNSDKHPERVTVRLAAQ